jgi:nicotinate phosphoribosyltransferase
MPISLLDTDLYKVLVQSSDPPRRQTQSISEKLTMQQAVLHHFPAVQATYRFTNRDKDAIFTRNCAEEFQDAVNGEVSRWTSNGHRSSIFVAGFARLEFSGPELEWLRITCPFLKQSYLSYLSTFRFDPSQVRITFVPSLTVGEIGNIDIEVVGPWRETILWEVPLMACLSETYYRVVMTDWSDESQAGEEQAGFSWGPLILNYRRRESIFQGPSTVECGLCIQRIRDTPKTVPPYP